MVPSIKRQQCFYNSSNFRSTVNSKRSCLLIPDTLSTRPSPSGQRLSRTGSLAHSSAQPSSISRSLRHRSFQEGPLPHLRNKNGLAFVRSASRTAAIFRVKCVDFGSRFVPPESSAAGPPCRFSSGLRRGNSGSGPTRAVQSTR